MILLDQAPSTLAWIRGKSYPGAHDYTPKTIAWVRDGRIIAGMMFNHYTGPSVEAHCAVERGWIPRRWCMACYRYAFDQLGVQRVTMPIARSNGRCIALASALGAVHEATLKDALPDGDQVIYVLWKRNVNARFFDRATNRSLKNG